MAIGYACKLIGVADTSITGCRLANATEEKLYNITEHNLLALGKIIDYTIENNIGLFRISSDIIPFGSHPAVRFDFRRKCAPLLMQIGDRIRQTALRVSMHPGQYTVLNSPNIEVVKRAEEDLQYHADFMDSLGLDETHKIILHIGGVYGNKENAKNAFLKAYDTLTSGIKKRLVIENDDRHYNIMDVLEISGITGIPVVFDHLHHILNLPYEDFPEDEWIERCAATWRTHDGRPKIHYSQPKEGGKCGAHSDTIDIGPFLEYYRSISGRDIDIMLEVKDKNISAIKCINALQRDLPARMLQQEWARYKYAVMASSEQVYRKIQALFCSRPVPDSVEFYTLVDSARKMPENRGAEVNAAQHVWGYFKREAGVNEKRRFEKLIAGYNENKNGILPVKRFLYQCAQKYGSAYLLQSYYFYLQGL